MTFPNNEIAGAAITERRPSFFSLHRMLRGAFIYVQISPTLLTLTNCTTGKTISEPPEIALRRSAKTTIHAVGSAAQLAIAQTHSTGLPPGVTMELANPFKHPRSIIADFTLAEHLLKHQLRVLCGKSLFQISPWIVIHPIGIPEGGYTPVEIRAMLELGKATGAASTVVWQGEALTCSDILSRHFPSTGVILA